ncbi:MAG: RNA methyltransferase substrate-binding domain-containing protein [Planctomycetia bacterium]
MKKTRGMKKPARAGRPASPPRPPRGPEARPRHQSKTEEMFHGLRACEAIFAKRPQEIVRVYVSQGRQRHFARLLEWCARERKGYQIVADENLERLTGSVHHEGIAILATQVRRQDLAALLGRVETSSLGPLGPKKGSFPLVASEPHDAPTMLRFHDRSCIHSIGTIRHWRTALSRE